MWLPQPLYVLRPFSYIATSLMGVAQGGLFPTISAAFLLIVAFRVLAMRYNAKQNWQLD